jgi:hypothetical protein
MWNVKAEAIPVIAGETSTISESLKQYLSNITQKHEIEELQNPAILDAAQKLWEVLI